MVVPVELWRQEIATLVRLGLLRREEARDREAVADAIGKVLDRVLRKSDCS